MDINKDCHAFHLAFRVPDEESSRLDVFFEAHERFMGKGGFLTPHKGVDKSKYASDTFRGLHDILVGATTFRFDGSDLMPGAVGAGSFWTGMVDYTNGKSAKDVADAIQSSWDAIK